MVRHSRNNTASASFTKAEYQMLGDRWGSKKIKLAAESFKQFDQCSLCLNRAESPVVCPEGHLICKECIFTALLDQKKEIAAVKVTLLNLEREHQAQRDRTRADAIERVQRDFERVQSGVNGGRRDTKQAGSGK
jgi:nitric oxide synthase-interacting protein